MQTLKDLKNKLIDMAIVLDKLSLGVSKTIDEIDRQMETCVCVCDNELVQDELSAVGPNKWQENPVGFGDPPVEYRGEYGCFKCGHIYVDLEHPAHSGMKTRCRIVGDLHCNYDNSRCPDYVPTWYSTKK